MLYVLAIKVHAIHSRKVARVALDIFSTVQRVVSVRTGCSSECGPVDALRTLRSASAIRSSSAIEFQHPPPRSKREHHRHNAIWLNSFSVKHLAAVTLSLSLSLLLFKCPYIFSLENAFSLSQFDKTSLRLLYCEIAFKSFGFLECSYLIFLRFISILISISQFRNRFQCFQKLKLYFRNMYQESGFKTSIQWILPRFAGSFTILFRRMDARQWTPLSTSRWIVRPQARPYTDSQSS